MQIFNKILKNSVPFLVNMSGNIFGKDEYIVITAKDYTRITKEKPPVGNLYRYQNCKHNGRFVFVDLLPDEARQVKQLIKSRDLVRTAGQFYQWNGFDFKTYLSLQKPNK